MASIRERWDPVVDGLVKKINGTLQDILGHGTIEYNEYSIGSLDTLPLIMGGGPDPLPEVHRGYRDGIEGALVKLRTLKELFEERIADAPQAAAPLRQKSEPGYSRRVFVVHGRYEGTKEAVARYLAKLDLDPIILHEQPSLGKTIVEKFESHADVAFAVVLFTPDDVGYPAGEPDKARPRARQNVVLELGFLLRRWAGIASVYFSRGILRFPRTTRESSTFRWTGLVPGACLSLGKFVGRESTLISTRRCERSNQLLERIGCP